jgi:hypothetical protein
MKKYKHLKIIYQYFIFIVIVIKEKIEKLFVKRNMQFSNKISLINNHAQPNGNEVIVYDSYLSNNIKNIMTYFAEQYVAEINKIPVGKVPSKQHLTSKLSTQNDLEAPWCRYWIRELKIPFRYHRKLWEFCFVLQVLFEHDMFGRTGIGFACGNEPLPSYLISRGCSITAGDKPLNEDDRQQQNWRSTNEYTKSANDLYHAHIIEKSTFDSNFTLSYVDMNALPSELDEKFDFCWSVCAIEHLGSIRLGIEFIKNSLKLLRNGGISVHTTEFNLLSNDQTIDNCGSVLFTKKYLLRLSDEISQTGGTLYPFDFNKGDGFFDRYYDMPPYPHQSVAGINTPLPALHLCPHIKLLIDGFPATCAGIIIKKN